MSSKSLLHLIATAKQIKHEREEDHKDEDVIHVSDTISVAVSVYETVRNTLEYDEEHLLRRNAIRRMLKRRLGEISSKELANKLIRELIWSRYLPNHHVPTSLVGELAEIFEKYKLLFAGLEGGSSEDQDQYDWLLDVLSTEIEYRIGPPCVDEALASYAYQALKEKTKWSTKRIAEADQDLQLYIGIHRAVLKSNTATLRYRVLTLFYPKWRSAKAGDPVVKEIAMHFRKVFRSVEQEISHESADAVFRFVRRHAVAFHLISDVVQDNPSAFGSAITSHDEKAIDRALTAAADARYATFRARLMRTVIRAALFLLLTKSILAVLVEYPYELFVLSTTDYLPLAVNILFPPFLLAVIGTSVRIPKKKNTAKILEEAHAFLGFGDEIMFVFKQKAPWTRGVLWVIFNLLYVGAFFGVLYAIVRVLQSLEFNSVSIVFFIFFLSLVAYFGIRIRNTRRDLLVLDDAHGIIQVIGDVLFLPIIRAGRWIAMRAPRVNIFLFFFDFIIEAPFKAAVEVIENWFSFLKEKREEL